MSQGELIDAFLVYQSLLVKQRPRGWCKELFCGCESRNKYAIYDPDSENNNKILEAMEDSSWCCRNCCGSFREFDMGIHTLDDREVLHFVRPYHPGSQGGLCCCCLPICFQELDIFLGKDCQGAGQKIGFVREECSFCLPKLTCRNSDDEIVYTIVGECCGCLDYKFHVLEGTSNNKCGVIKKKWSGFRKEWFTDADNFYISFPQNASAIDRSLLLGATFLIDFLYFENNQRNNN